MGKKFPSKSSSALPVHPCIQSKKKEKKHVKTLRFQDPFIDWAHSLQPFQRQEQKCGSRRTWKLLPHHPSIGSIRSFHPLLTPAIDNHVTKDRSCMDPQQNASVYYTLQESICPGRSYVVCLLVTQCCTVLKLLTIVFSALRRSYWEGKEVADCWSRDHTESGNCIPSSILPNTCNQGGNYWVTIIPNCRNCANERDFFRFLLAPICRGRPWPSWAWLWCKSWEGPTVRKLIVDIESCTEWNGSLSLTRSTVSLSFGVSGKSTKYNTVAYFVVRMA